MRALVTGGTGLVGSNIAQELLRQGHDVVMTGSSGEQKIPGFAGKIFAPSGVNWKEIGCIDAVFHQAAITDTTVMDRQKMFGANVDFSSEVFTNAVRNGCRRIVYASSTAVYGDSPAPYKEDVTPLKPLNPYSESKVLLEECATRFAKEHPDVRVVGLRYCNVYGPGESHKGKMATMIYQLAQQMKNGERPRIFKFGEQKRDYIYVKDVVRANLCALEAQENCIVNCGAGKATTFNELVDILNETLGAEHNPEYIDNPYDGAYQAYTECDMTLAREKLGFVPEYDIRRGINEYHEQGHLVPDGVKQ